MQNTEEKTRPYLHQSELRTETIAKPARLHLPEHMTEPQPQPYKLKILKYRTETQAHLHIQKIGENPSPTCTIGQKP